MPCSLAQTMRYHYLDNIPYSKMCELCELFVKKSHRFRDGIYLFLLSIIYSLPSTSGTPEWQLEQPQASGTREAQMEQRAAPYPYSKMCNAHSARCL